VNISASKLSIYLNIVGLLVSWRSRAKFGALPKCISKLILMRYESFTIGYRIGV